MTKTRIDRLGHLGDGIAESGEFVPFTLPGEEVEIGPPLKVINASPARTTPVCAHFGICGGCTLQHADDAFLARWKAKVVMRALNAQGLDIAVPDATGFPAMTRRRAVFAGRRTKKGAQVGFHTKGSDQIIAVDTCHLILPEMLALRTALEALTRIGASRKGQVRLQVSESETGWDVDVGAAKPLEQAMMPGLAEIVNTYDMARLTWEGEVVILNRQPIVRFGAVQVTPPPGAFLQASKPAENALIAAVRESLGTVDKVLDLFAGCGTFSLALAPAAEVHAVETSAEMLEALAHGWRNTPGLKSVTTQARDLFRRPLQVDELQKFQGVVIDPPRAGAEAQSKLLAKSSVPVIAAVSCNPVSFARDAAILVAGGYRLDWVRAIDQFRWSPHIEVAARFSR